MALRLLTDTPRTITYTFNLVFKFVFYYVDLTVNRHTCPRSPLQWTGVLRDSEGPGSESRPCRIYTGF